MKNLTFFILYNVLLSLLLSFASAGDIALLCCSYIVVFLPILFIVIVSLLCYIIS